MPKKLLFTDQNASEFCFSHKILQISDGIESPGSIVWELLLCDMVSWIIVFLCIMNGVKSVGKVVYFTATFPFVILFVLFVRGVTLPGAWEGISFYIYPQWNQLLSIKVRKVRHSDGQEICSYYRRISML